jgi:TP901 family phage tail tape measure protein
MLNIDPAGAISGLGQVNDASEGFVAQMRTMTAAATPVQRALDMITPSRVLLAGMSGLAVAAGNVQEQLAPMAATAHTTGASFHALSASSRMLARDIPLGGAGARALTQELARLTAVSSGSEQQIGSLGKVFGRLSGATGENPGALAVGFVQLNRAMSTGFDPSRVEKLGDSLTTVAAKSGASATGILGFAKSIAPLAQASGIGETKVLGISAAFAKLGDDGLGAGTAFNKMLGDMNRSVREGSPDIAAYAQIVGKTTDQFMALTKTNPGEAIAQVFEGINKAGPNGPRLLEQLGLDGVRTQRYIQSVSQSGGIRSMMGESTSAYGSGSTKEAADKAFSGWAASATRLKSTTEELVDALGTPMLGAVSGFTDLLRHAAQPVASFAGSRPVQDIMKVAIAAAIPLLIGLKVAGPLGNIALGAQALTSSITRGAAAGFVTGRGGTTGRFTTDFAARQVAGMPVSSNATVDRAATRLYQATQRLGMMMPAGSGGPGVFSALRNVGSGGVGAVLRMQAEQMRMARTGFAERQYLMRPYGQPYEDYARTRTGVRDAHAAGLLSDADRRSTMAAARADMWNQVRGQSLGTNVGQTARGLGAFAYEGARLSGSLAGSAAGMVGRTLGSPMALLTGATIGWEVIAHQRAAREQAVAAARSNSSFIDDYRVAMGKATEATSTFAGRMQQTAESMASAVTSMTDAMTISAQDVQAANAVRGKPVVNFAGTTSGVAAQLRLQRRVYGSSPDELARISYDLINQYGQRGAQSIMSQSGIDGGSVPDDVRAAVQGISRGKAAGGFRGFAARHLDIVSALSPGKQQGSAEGTISGLSDAQVKAGRGIATTIKDQLADNAQKYGQNYANSQARQAMDAAIQTAMEEGNQDLVQSLIQSFQSNFTPGEDTRKISWKTLQQAGSYSAAQGALSPTFKQNFAVSGDGAPVLQESYYSQRARGTGLERLFGHQGIGPDTFDAARSSVNDLLTSKMESPGAQAAALSATITAFTRSGQSLEQIADAAAKGATSFDNAADGSNRFAMALQQAAMAAIASRPTVVTQASMATTLAGRYLGPAGNRPTNANDAQLRQQSIEGLRSIQDQTKQAIIGRLSAQREYQVQSKRSQDDFNLQMSYADADFKRSMLRGEHDFNLQRFRANRDNARSMLNAEVDFQRQRQYAIEDGARSAYSAYQRIAVQQTWDAPNLTGNINEQADALQAQLENLAKVRAGGMQSNTIKLLGLNDPQNAQQLASLVGDMVNDPSVTTALNSAAKRRQGLGEQLMGDQDNTPLVRQRKEFDISMGRAKDQFRIAMGDMAQSYKITVNRATEDRNTAVSRMTDANTRMIKRAGEDLARADEEIVGSLDKLSTALNTAINKHFVDFSTLTQSSMSQWMTLANHFAGDWKDLVAGLSVTATFTTNANTDLPPPGAGTVPPAPAKTAAPAHPPIPFTPSGADQTGGHFYPNTKMGPAKKHALGGILTTATMVGPNDVAGEAGPEALIPLDRRGATAIAEAMHQFVSRDQARLMTTAAAATYITYDSSTHYTDAGVTIEHADVHGVSLEDAAEQAQALVRRGNMTSAPQRRR